MAVFANLIAGVVNSSGVSATGMLAYFYEPGSGSTTLKTVYSDAALSVPAANPYPLDDGGRATLYGRGDYRIRVTASDGTLVQDVPTYDCNSTYADLVTLRNATGYVGTGDWYTGTTVDAALQVIKTSAGAKDAKYRHSRAAATVGSVTLQAKLSRTFDVKDFGATGAGTSDDSTYVQAAFTACVANGGGTVWFPAGTYRCDTGITVGSCTGMIVAGDGGAIVKQYSASPPAAFTLFDVNANTAVWFDNLTLYGMGTGASSAAIGINIPSSNVGARVTDCTFSGPQDGQGFNIGVKLGGTQSFVRGCKFDRIYNTSTGAGVSLAAATYPRIEGCMFTMVDGGGTRGASGVRSASGASGGLVMADCTVSGSTGYGIDLGPDSTTVYCSHSSIRGCYILGNQGGGVRLTTCDDSTVDACDFGANLGSSIYTGVSSATATGGAQRLVITNNRIVGSASTGHGIYLLGTNNATVATAHPSTCVISNNTIQACGYSGIRLESADDCVVSNNIVKECSRQSTGTYPAIFVTTVGTSNPDGGGKNNVITGNVVRDSSTSYHSAALTIEDSGGGANLVNTNVVLTNSFPLQNSAGTPVHVKYGGTANRWGAAGGNAIAGSLQVFGMQTGGVFPFSVIVASATLTIGDAYPRILLVDTTAGAVVLTLPDFGADSTIDEYNGFIYKIVKIAGSNTLTITPTTNDIYDRTSAALQSTLALATAGTIDVGLEIIYYNGTWYPIHAQSADWT